MSARAKDDCMSIGAVEAHFVEDDGDVFLLKIVELSFGKMIDPKGVSNGGDEDRIPVDECTGCRDSTACKSTREALCFSRLAFELIILFLAYSLDGAEAFVGSISQDFIDAFGRIISLVFDIDVPRLVISCDNWSSGAGENCADYLEEAFE